MAGFIQIIEWKSSKLDEIKALQEDFRAAQQAAGHRPGPARITVTADRDGSDTYLTVVEFDDHDEAMANNARAETAEFAERMMALCDGPPIFRNLDVVDQVALR